VVLSLAYLFVRGFLGKLKLCCQGLASILPLPSLLIDEQTAFFSYTLWKVVEAILILALALVELLNVFVTLLVVLLVHWLFGCVLEVGLLGSWVLLHVGGATIVGHLLSNWFGTVRPEILLMLMGRRHWLLRMVIFLLVSSLVLR
jgi:hypothetical protein